MPIDHEISEEIRNSAANVINRKKSSCEVKITKIFQSTDCVKAASGKICTDYFGQQYAIFAYPNTYNGQWEADSLECTRTILDESKDEQCFGKYTYGRPVSSAETQGASFYTVAAWLTSSALKKAGFSDSNVRIGGQAAMAINLSTGLSPMRLATMAVSVWASKFGLWAEKRVVSSMANMLSSAGVDRFSIENQRM